MTQADISLCLSVLCVEKSFSFSDSKINYKKSLVFNKIKLVIWHVAQRLERGTLR